jgi:anti-anti-sigma factor
MPNDEPSYVSFESRGDAEVGTILGSDVVEASRVGEFGKYLMQYVAEHPGIRLMLNFNQVEYMSSSTLTELIRVKEAIEKSGGQFGICGLRRDVRRVFQVTNLERHMNVHPDEDVASAIERFGGAPA